MREAIGRDCLRQWFFEWRSKAFPLNVMAGTRYPEKQLSGLGI